eukprot:TRINITY_DN20963_c0_g1_i3.p1 TRINITY_DN20963_c0_g1~~TRINITY_DN20963_c0_g1_i3.p1  ORF type:complete len:615 (+),score=164.56 TRINITY_DN20963_c0_g1_i3:70-1845(+)
MEYILLALAWCLSLFQYSWMLGKEKRGEVPKVEGKQRTPFTSWVVGTMLVVDCEGAVGDVTEMTLQSIKNAKARIRLTGVVLRFECHNVKVQDISKEHPAIRVVSWFSPLVPESSLESLKGGLLSDGKVYSRRADKKGLNQGHLIDFDSVKGKAWAETTLKELIAQGVRGVYCDPIDHVLIGSTGEFTAKRYINQRDYSRAYYWGVFDLGRELLGYDFVILGAGVSSFGSVTGARLMPTDRGMASIIKVYNGINTDKDSLVDTIYSAFRASQFGYLNFATSPVPAYLKAPNLEEKILSVQLSSGLPLLLISHKLSDGVLGSDAIHPAVEVNAAVHGELQPYLHGASSLASVMNTSIVLPLRPLSEYELFQTPTEHSFYLGKDLLVCPMVDPAASVLCSPGPNDGGVWKKATSRADELDVSKPVGPSFATPVYMLKRVGVGLPLRPYGKLSPLLWNQYGMPAPAKSTLTLLFDSPKRETLLDVSGPSKRHCLQANVTLGEGNVTARLTPWDEPLLIVLRNIPIPAVASFIIRYKREPVNTTHPLFSRESSLWNLHSVVGSLTESSYFAEKQDMFISMPPIPRGATLLIFKAP